MYDGIGLKTPRGSGTNGHVERNLATVRNKLTNVSYLDLDEPQDSDTDDAPVKRKLLTFDRRHGDLICYRDLDDVDEPIMFTAINEPAPRPKKPLNKEILEHNRKRKIELRCFELSEELEDQGFTTDEVKEKVEAYRSSLLELDADSEATKEDPK